MKYTVPILILLLLGAWILGGTWLYHNSGCCQIAATTAADNSTTNAIAATDNTTNNALGASGDNNTAPAAATTQASPMLIKDGNKEVAKSEDNFSFVQSNSRPIIPASTNGAFKDLATYLKDNPKRQLVLTGHYKADERKVNPNLGVARAEGVKRKLRSLGVNNNQMATKGVLDDGLAFENNKTRGGVDFDFADLVTGAATGNDVAANTNAPASANDNAAKIPPIVVNAPGLRIRENANVSFPKSGFECNQPLDPKVQNAYKKIGEYMGKNADKQLTITGDYSKDEENKSLLPTLGLARANNVKQELIKAGVSSQQVETKDRLRPNLKFPDGVLQGGVSYRISNAPPKPAANADGSEGASANDARLAQIEKDLKAGPITVYFQTAKTELVMDAKIRKRFGDLIYYMDKKTDVEVSVTGHTDNVGSDAANMKYGEGRAKFVKDYMAKNGSPVNRITSSSKGESAPIVANDTPENKAKNRRVEVRLK